MGCDIHGYVEVNPLDGNWWQPTIDLKAFSLRNYRFFSGLFGVRGPDGVAKNRGLPKEFLRFDDDLRGRLKQIQETDYHSYTWATFEELKKKWLEISEELFGYDQDWMCLYELCDKLQRRFGTDKVRLVVWFDN